MARSVSFFATPDLVVNFKIKFCRLLYSLSFNYGLNAVAAVSNIRIRPAMLLPVFHDLIKSKWLLIIETLKRRGGMSVSELCEETKGSYMTVKTHCDELADAGYLLRTRLPRREVGRPEIFYSLAAKADTLFPQAGVDFSLDLLDELRLMHGESAPERLLFQHFSKRAAQYEKQLGNLPGVASRARKLAVLRYKDGCASHCEEVSGEPLRIMEFHNPLQRIFERYPRAVMMEQRMIEQALGTRVTRSEIPAGRETMPRVVFELA
jgi:predicted ArsR family transcriptional regulator